MLNMHQVEYRIGHSPLPQRTFFINERLRLNGKETTVCTRSFLTALLDYTLASYNSTVWVYCKTSYCAKYLSISFCLCRSNLRRSPMHDFCHWRLLVGMKMKSVAFFKAPVTIKASFRCGKNVEPFFDANGVFTPLNSSSQNKLTVSIPASSSAGQSHLADTEESTPSR